MDLENLFSSAKIGNIQIKNRIIRSATWVAKATNDGYITEDLIILFKDLAEGGTGLIISGYIAVDPSGAVTHRMTCLYNDSYISGQKKLVNMVHDYSEVKIAAQIAHTGNNFYLRSPIKNIEPVGPSPFMNFTTNSNCRELTTDEVREVIKSFVDTGRRAYESGYDLIQIHGSHHYLLSDFVSPFTNKRMDEYGGDVHNRARILVEIHDLLRDELGKNFPIFIKLNTQDYIQNGLTLNEGKEIAKILIDTGYDAIEPSSGLYNLNFSAGKVYPCTILKSEEDENYFLPNVRLLKPVMKDHPIILQGGIRNPMVADEFIKNRVADFIALSRPLIYEPNLPNRWKSGDFTPPLCTNCNSCLNVGATDTVYCVVKKKSEKN
ncbi:MAG: NADH:flavin oxidoreductase [Promethearchaeota archaeon]|jgi:2,4-dienoyl-CoA reductase-like NADH-dependent reductase (Old Yellow Enzyme family)